jgi:hypothetical protein
MELKEQGILSDYIKELRDTKLQLDIEIANCDNSLAKAQMIETKYKTIVAMVNIDKQRRKIFPKQMI